MKENEKKSAEETAEPMQTKEVVSNKTDANKPLIIGLACAGGVLLIVVSIGTTLLFHSLRVNMSQGLVQPGIIRHIGSRGYTNRPVNRQPNQTGTVTRGVVLSVTSDGFIMAGNGKQYTVQTSSSTTYNTSSHTVVANDSVIVSGDNANGTITATRVSVKNQ